MEQKIKWILFDLSGVVVHLTFKKLEGYSIGSRFFEAEKLEGIFATKDHHDYCLGLLSHEQSVSRYLKAKKLDLSVEEFDQLLKEDIMPIEGITPLIETLEKKFKIALATNGGKEIVKCKIEKSGVMSYLSKIIASYRIRLLKPDIAFYKKTVQMIDAKPAECVFIDDTQENIDAANAIGMKGILFTNVPALERELNLLHLL